MVKAGYCSKDSDSESADLAESWGIFTTIMAIAKAENFVARSCRREGSMASKASLRGESGGKGVRRGFGVLVDIVVEFRAEFESSGTVSSTIPSFLSLAFYT